AAHFFHDERVGGVQDEGVVAEAGLQGLQPGMDVLRRELGFEAFETTGPGIHGHSMGRTTNESAARIGRQHGTRERDAAGYHSDGNPSRGRQRLSRGVEHSAFRRLHAEHSTPIDPWSALALQQASGGTSSRPRGVRRRGGKSPECHMVKSTMFHARVGWHPGPPPRGRELVPHSPRQGAARAGVPGRGCTRRTAGAPPTPPPIELTRPLTVIPRIPYDSESFPSVTRYRIQPWPPSAPTSPATSSASATTVSVPAWRPPTAARSWPVVVPRAASASAPDRAGRSRRPMPSRNTLPRAARIRASADFARVFEGARRTSAPELSLHWLRDGAPPRLGLAVSRKADPTAVGRNRIKRQLREGFRQLRPGLAPGAYVVVARASARTLG